MTDNTADQLSMITSAQFRMMVLESADGDGRIHAPALTDWFATQSLLIGMWMEGLIERRCRMSEAGPYFITAKGIEMRSRHG